jgi:general secretion pathway protein A
MYEQYYGLTERPFDLSPNPRFLLLTAGHREALLHLRYGLTGRPGVTVLVGEAGTGKTTIVRAALEGSQRPEARIVHLSNPTLSRTEFYEYLAAGFHFTESAGSSKSAFLRALEESLMARAADNGVLALIVDEAQTLPHELLEEIRLLTNSEVRGRTVTVALVGQPELAARLNDPNLRQLKQRVSLRCSLPPLTLNETAAYISARVRTAGGSADLLFTRDAIMAIHKHAKGIPRLISVICDNALVSGFAADAKPIGRDIVLEVCRDFELDSADAPPLPAPPAMAPRPEPDRRAPVESRPLFSAVTRARRFSFL